MMKKLPGSEVRPSSFMYLLCVSLMASCATTPVDKGSAGLSSQTESGYACADQRSDSTDPNSYQIQPGDELELSFYLNPEFDESSVIVRPDGKIALRFIGDIKAAGQTPVKLGAALNEAYSSELRHPGAAVIVKNSPSRVVYVAGQVSKPGTVPLVPRMTLMDAIAASGGLTNEAGADKVVIARRDPCGNISEQIINVNPLLKGSAKTEEDVALSPADLVVVPRSFIANVDLVVKQYVRDVLPIQPFLGIP